MAQALDASKYDLSTEQGVTAARESLTGKKLTPGDQGCIKRSGKLPIIVVGTRSIRFGRCVFDGVFVKAHYLQSQDAALSKTALELLGWKSANRKQREQLARAWVMEGWLGFKVVLSEKNNDFNDRSFQAPQAVSKDNGEVVVTLWEQLRGRGRAIGTTTYFLREYRFGPDGDFAGEVQLERFSLGRSDP
ncbi:MAG: hypothetical protein ACXWID_05405 [Pyrinomonadaceae bacterium]